MAEPRTIPGHWDIYYKYSIGDTAAAFFDGLRDECILGSRCARCSRVLVPARSFCERCFEKTTELVEVGPEGFVQTFTLPATPTQARGESFSMIAIIKLDGADSGLPHFVENADLSSPEALLKKVVSGFRVRARFRPVEQRVGDILDIAHFYPVDTASS
jgi:uncharacterized protein